MRNRQAHQQEVRRYLEKHFSSQDWIFSLPSGSGMETYFVHGNEHEYFVKVGAPVEKYLAMAEIGLFPPVLLTGRLESGASIFVQPRIRGRSPSRLDFQSHWQRVARLVGAMHGNPHVRHTLPPACSTLHKDAGLQAFNNVFQRWEHHRALVPDVAAFIESSLADLALQINQLSGDGLAACHNDICNANWLFAADGHIFIIDLDAMSMEDPALDLGALLWWYFPAGLRREFLDYAGYPYDDEFKFRMRVRMALHCLHIMLPREQSFDKFYLDHFYEFLTDFRAVLDGKENPQGYTA